MDNTDKSDNRPKTESTRKAPSTAFKPGQTGNAGGRPKLTEEDLDVRAACKKLTPKALEVIQQIMEFGENEKNRLSSAQIIIERGYGKPEQPVDATIKGNVTVEIVHFGVGE